MTRRTLLTGPELSKLESHAFDDLTKTVGSQPESLLYLTTQDHPEEPTRERWKVTGSSACLRINTMDDLVADCFERVEYKGRVTHVDRPLLYRLAELGVERIGTPANPFSSGEGFPRAGLVDAAEGIFTELEFGGLLSPDEMRTRLETEGLSEQATHIHELAAAIETVRDTTLADEMPETFRTERMHHVTELDRSLSEVLPTVDAVVLGPFLQFDALERRFLQRIVAQWPTIALLPKQIDAMAATGTDAACERVIDTYDELDFTHYDIRDGDSPTTTARQHLVQNLYRHPSVAPSPEEITPQSLALDYNEAETIPEEAREVARTIREIAAEDTELGDIGIAPLSPSAYRETVEEILDAYEIPYSVETEIPFGNTALGDAVETLSDLTQAPRSLDSLLGLLTNPLVEIPEDHSSIDPQALAQLASRADTPRIESVQSEMDSDTAAAVDAMLADIQQLATTDLAQLTDAVTDVLATFGIKESLSGDSLSRPVQARESSAKRRLDRVLETLEITASAADPEIGTPIDRLERALSNVTIRETSHGGSNAVTICSPGEAVKHDFDQIFVLGVTATHVPTTPDQLAFLKPIYEADADFEQRDQAMEARYHLGCILGSSADVHLSAPERSLDGEPFTEPDIITELRRIIDVDALSEDHSRSRPGTAEDVQRSLSHASSGPIDAGTLERAKELDSFNEPQVSNIQRGNACAAGRANPMLTEYDGDLSEETVAQLHDEEDREPYSPSRIETYASCGFKYYAKQVLDIESPDEIQRDPDASARGSYIHDVLEHYYRTLKSSPSAPVTLPGDFDSRQEHLLSTALERLDTAFSEYPETAFHDAWLRQVLAGLATPEVNDYYHPPSGTSGDRPPKGLFYRFLEHEANKLAMTTARPYLFEARVGEPHSGGESLQREPATIETPDGRITVHGLIDRIDIVQSDAENEMVVRDYKTGSTPGEAETLLGLSFQLPLYALMAESGVSGAETVGGAYYKVSPPTSVNSRKGLVTSKDKVTWHDADEVSTPLLRYSKPHFKSHDAFRRFVTQTTPQRLELIDASIDDGRFHPTVLDPSDAGCRYCDYANVCDVRSHQRKDTIEKIDESDITAYIAPIARDVDAEDIVEVS